MLFMSLNRELLILKLDIPFEIVLYANFHVQSLFENVYIFFKFPLENSIICFSLSNLIEKQNVGFSHTSIAIGLCEPSDA